MSLHKPHMHACPHSVQAHYPSWLTLPSLFFHFQFELPQSNCCLGCPHDDFQTVLQTVYRSDTITTCSPTRFMKQNSRTARLISQPYMPCIARQGQLATTGAAKGISSSCPFCCQPSCAKLALPSNMSRSQQSWCGKTLDMANCCKPGAMPCSSWLWSFAQKHAVCCCHWCACTVLACASHEEL